MARRLARHIAVGLSPLAILILVHCDSDTSPGASSGSGSGGATSGVTMVTGGPGTGGATNGTTTGTGMGTGGMTPADASVYFMHNHIDRDGLFVDSALTKAALSGGMVHLDPTFTGTIVGNVYASPLYVQDGVKGKGTFYIATESNNVYALDETTGAVVNMKSAGTAATQTGAGCGNIGPLGITGTPAIDAASRLIVFDAATADANGNVATHTIHAWSIDDFTEKWSFDVSTLNDPVVGTFMPQPENQRSAVLIVNGVAYVTWGGHYGDCGDYHGWVVGIPLAAGPAGVKSYATPSTESGMWASGGPASDGTDIFVATGNGAQEGGAWGGEFAVLRFTTGPKFSGATTDYFNAINDDGDEDLGGSAPLVVDAPSMTPSKLIVQLGKDGYIYLLDRTNLNGGASPMSSAHIMDSEISNAAAFATVGGTTYVAMVNNSTGNGGMGCGSGNGGLVVVKLDPAAPSKVTIVWCATNQGGSPSITTSDGQNDALVWTVGSADNRAGAKSNKVLAWDLATGTPVVTGSDAVNNMRHFTAPIFVHGRLITAADNAVYALKP